MLVAVRGVVVVVVPGLRVAVAEPVAELRGLLSAALPGLDMIELVLRAEALEVVDFLSSSLALILSLLLWLAVEVDEVAVLRTVEVGGRVGGLLKPVAVRVLAAVGLVAVDVEPGRRVALVAEAAPGRFTTGFLSPFSLAGVSGEAGVAACGLSGSAWASVGEATASSGWTMSKLSVSDMVCRGNVYKESYSAR